MPENTTHSAGYFTPYLDKVKLPSGNEYWFQDAWAQERLDSLGDIVVGGDGVHFKGETTSQLTDEITTNPIVIDGQNYTPAIGDLVIYAKREFVWSGSKWLELGDLSSFGALATKDSATGSIDVPIVISATFSGNEGPVTISTASSAGGNYQPSGTISKPGFTGTAATITVSGVPSGSVSKPTFSGEPATISVSGIPNGSVSKPTFNGTAATISVSGIPSGSVSKPSFTGTAGSVSVSGIPNGTVDTPTISVVSAGSTTAVNSITSVGSLPSLIMKLHETDVHMLEITWNSGTLPSIESKTVKTGDASYQASAPTFTGSTSTFSGSYTPAGTVSTPEFTGSTSTFTGTYTPAGTVSTPNFTGATSTFTGSYTPAGTVSTPEFTGSTSTFSGSYTPSGSVAQPTFTGTTVQISGVTTPSGTVTVGTGSTNINVSVS